MASNISNHVVTEFLASYDSLFSSLKTLAEKVRSLCDQRLKDAQIKALVTSRVKSKESLEKKLEDRERQFQEDHNGESPYHSQDDILNDIVDFAGVRISLYFPNHTEDVKDLIETTFEAEGPLIPGSAKDRLEDESHRDIFPGYEGIHYRVRLKEPFNSSARVEIQVMSVLHHAWSEVNHDIQYKPEGGEPSKTEKMLLDSLKGQIMAAQRIVETLYEHQRERIGRSCMPFRNKYELGNFLFGTIQFNDGEVNKSFLGVLHRFLKVTKKDTREDLGQILDKIGFQNQDSEQLQLLTSKFNPFDKKPSIYIMDTILGDPSFDGGEDAMKKSLSLHEGTEDQYRCKILLSALSWLGELFTPYRKLEQVWGSCKKDMSRTELESITWLCTGDGRVDILRGEEVTVSQQRYLDIAWKWFSKQHSQGGSYLSLAFKISKMVVLREIDPAQLEKLDKFTLTR